MPSSLGVMQASDELIFECGTLAQGTPATTVTDHGLDNIQTASAAMTRNIAYPRIPRSVKIVALRT